MQGSALLFLRVSVGLLVLLWGIDKIVNVDHAMAVSEGFYRGLFSSALLLKVWGVFQSVVGALTIAGLYRRWIYPIVIAINGVTLLGVWRSIIDPWGWVLEGTNVLFFPSLIIFAASLLLWAYRAEDELALDGRGARRDASRQPTTTTDDSVARPRGAASGQSM